MRRFVSLMIVVLTGCGPIQSAQVQDQVNAMIGQSQEHVLSCMGPPTSTAQVGTTEVWSYSTNGPVTTSAVMGGNQSIVAGSATTSQEYCIVNLTMRSGFVTAANTRSQGKLLAPNLQCYALLHACAPNLMPASTIADRNKEAIAFCKKLSGDPRLDPLRGVIAFDAAPTLEMESNPGYITDGQKPALDVLKTTSEQCRDNWSRENLRLWQILVQAAPNPAERLKELYDRKATIGQYNTYRQEVLDKIKSALADASK